LHYDLCENYLTPTEGDWGMLKIKQLCFCNFDFTSLFLSFKTTPDGHSINLFKAFRNMRKIKIKISFSQNHPNPVFNNACYQGYRHKMP